MNSVQIFADPACAEAAYKLNRIELMPTSRADFSVRMTRVEFDNLWLHSVQEGGARIKYAEQSPTRAYIKFLSAGSQGFVSHGLTLPPDGILRHSRGDRYYDQTFSSVHWASLSLPVEQLVAAGTVMAGCDLSPPNRPSIVTPTPAAMIKLRHAHAEATSLAEFLPAMLTSSEVVRGLEQSLIEAWIECLAAAELRNATSAQRCHQMVMRRFRDLLQDYADRPLYVPEICAAIRVPERTLRLCCQEHLGMSPKHYLMLRRMHLARRALCNALPGEMTVTQAATRFGFWHFGRFAGTYHSIFGEAPSVTLHRPPD